MQTLADQAATVTPRPTLGRIVHFVLPVGSPRMGEHRAAIVTGCFGSDLANLTVFLDQTNDHPPDLIHAISPFELRAWSTHQDEETKAPGTWHWPERV